MKLEFLAENFNRKKPVGENGCFYLDSISVIYGVPQEFVLNVFRFPLNISNLSSRFKISKTFPSVDDDAWIKI